MSAKIAENEREGANFIATYREEIRFVFLAVWHIIVAMTTGRKMASGDEIR